MWKYDGKETRVWEMRLRSEDKDDAVHEEKHTDGEYIPVLEFDFLAILNHISETPLFSDSHLGYKTIMLNDVFIEAVKAEEEMIRNVAGMKSSCQCFQITETEDFVRKPECRQGCIMCMDYGNLKFSGIIDRKYWFSWRTNNKKNFTFITEKGIIQQKCSTKLDLLPAYEVISTVKQQDAREKHHNCF
ncbi:unnamed protein product [Mytilus edulis]|uniref:Uncharacterized protein n=1 Tax=Mytilus edulis TaxID=6550 RepID=A0A8S3VBK6_MYTED|nr:unnamed protein product [Mytilus edulis]